MKNYKSLLEQIHIMSQGRGPDIQYKDTKQNDILHHGVFELHKLVPLHFAC